MRRQRTPRIPEGWWQPAPGVWTHRSWAPHGVVYGFAERSCSWTAQCQALRIPEERLVLLEQCHGAAVASVDRPTGQPVPACDAAVTHQPEVALAIRTADCVPLVVYDTAKRLLGAAHIGWRGLVAGLPERLLRALATTWGSRPADLLAVMAPSVRGCCYEVRADVAGQLPQDIHRARGRMTLDLPEAVRGRLLAAGLPEAMMLDAQRCTRCESERFFSVRGDGPATGRMLTVAMLTPT